MRIFLFIWVFAFSFLGAAAAQTISTTGAPSESAVVVPEDLTPEVVRDLVSGLSDSEVRSLLLQRLDAVAEEQAQAAGGSSGGFSELLSMATRGVLSSISDAVTRLPQLGDVLRTAFSAFLEQIGPNGLMVGLIAVSAAVIGALIVEFVFRRLIRNWVERIDVSGSTRSLRDTLSFLAKRLTGDIVAVIIFLVAANVIGTFVGIALGSRWVGDPTQGAMLGAYIASIWGSLVVLPRMAAAVGRFFMAPNKPEYRILYADDAAAQRIYRSQIILALLIGLIFWAPQFIAMGGIPYGEARLGFWLNTAMHAYVIWFIWRDRAAFTLLMRGPDPDVTVAEAWAARAYPWFVIIAVALTWWLVEVLAGFGRFDLLQGMPHIYMLFLISYAPALDTMIRGLVRHLMPPMRGEGAVAERAYDSARSSYIRIGRVITFALVIMLIARIWQIDLSNLAAAGVGVQLAGRLIELMIVLAFGYLVYELVSLYINRKLAAEMTASGYDPDNADFGGDGGGAGGSRLSTVLPLVLLVARSAIVVIFVLLALGNVGIDTTPLLAGAGIVGLAIGFGAQKLVSDIVSGVFFLVDDAFRTGEYVEVDGTMGTVEKISIRSMQLRHHRGPVHTIPYGEIPKLTNYSRDWVIMKLKFTVPFDTDPNKVKKIFKKIGAEMLDNELFKDDFLQPFKSQGVFEIDDVGMVMRGKFMAKPGKQFMIRKEIYNRVKAEFEANGIDFARREVRVALPGHDDGEPLTDAEQAAVTAAAAAAIQQQEEEQAQKS